MIALNVLFDCVGHRYSSEPNSETSSRYGEALSSIANVLEPKPECVCNVRTEPVVVECAQFAAAPCEQILFYYMSLFGLFGLVCGLLGNSEWASGQGLEVLTSATLSLSLFVWMSTALLPRDAVLVIFQADLLLWHHRVILSEAVGAHQAQYVLTPDLRVKLMRLLCGGCQ